MSFSIAKNIFRRALCRFLLREHGVSPITKSQWKTIKGFFCGCAYCGLDLPLTKEHLVGINDTEYGTDHPSNIVPSCKNCQQRKFVRIPGTNDSKQDNWENHLRKLLKKDTATFELRRKRIKDHINNYKHKGNLLKLRKKIDQTIRQADEKIDQVIAAAIVENKKT